jgi:uncharacterized membrane protein YedE/YeeE
MQSFVNAAIGGVLIGLAATLLLLLNGRLAGLSGILRGVIFPVAKKEELLWRLLFLFGLISGAAIIYMLNGNHPVPRPNFPPLLLVAAGLLVGFGTSMGSGCTSGHGVCGLGLLSSRSFFAIITFMVVAILTTFVLRHVFGIY